MGSFRNYLQKRTLNEMGYIILPKAVSMPMGHKDEPIEVRMFDMQYELYPAVGGLSKLSQYSPIVGKIPGTSRSYLVWNGLDARIVKLSEEELQSLLSQEEMVGSKAVKYTLLPDNWFHYAKPVD